MTRSGTAMERLSGDGGHVGVGWAERCARSERAVGCRPRCRWRRGKEISYAARALSTEICRGSKRLGRPSSDLLVGEIMPASAA
nr:hypothetical protein CFP56_13385 [Quercus suber]